MTLLNLEGWPASGKTILWGLLDGESSIFMDPLHTYVPYAFIDKPLDERPTIREFRQALSRTEYFKIEQTSFEGYYPISYGKGKNKNWKFEFNYTEFDKEFMRFIFSENPTYSQILNDFYNRYIRYYEVGKHQDYRYFCTMSNYFEYKKFYNEFNYEKKTIVLLRDAVDIIASRTSREARETDGNKTKNFAPDFHELIKNGEVEEIECFNKFYREKSQTDNNILCIEFNSIFKDKIGVIKNILQFLEIEFSPLYLKPTRDGIDLNDDIYQLDNKPNDTSKLLNLKQRFVIKFHKFLFRIHKQPFNIMSLRSIVAYIYLKFKNLR